MTRLLTLLFGLIFSLSTCFAEEIQAEGAEVKPFDYVVETKGTAQVEGDFVVEITNLNGKVTCEHTQENKVEWQISTHSIAKDEKRAKELGDKLKIKAEVEEGQSPKKIALSLFYPVSEHFIYYYPAKEVNKKKGASKYKTKLVYQEKDVTVMLEPSLAAIYLFADITIKIPKDCKLIIKNYVGEIRAKDIQGELNCESMSAPLFVDGGQGKLVYSTSSGSSSVKGYSGEIACASGDGKLEFSAIKGNIQLTTGSGSVSFEDCQLDDIQVKSGSGAVVLNKTEGNLIVTTGSGRLQADDFVAKKLIKVETGSGQVRLKGDLSTLENAFIQTGSGDINFVSTPFPKLVFDARTASGEISVKVPTMHSKPSSSNQFFGSIDPEFDLACVTFRSGSGDISLGTLKKSKSKQKQKKNKE